LIKGNKKEYRAFLGRGIIRYRKITLFIYTGVMVAYRKANESDIELLSALAQLCFTDTFGHLYEEKHLLNHLDQTCSPDFFYNALQHNVIILAETKEKVLIGYIKVGEVEVPLESCPAEAKEIHRLYIHPEFKRNNVGSALMHHALGDVIFKTAEHCYLSVYQANRVAQKFYHKFGFNIIGEYDYYVGPHIDREYIMHKTLTKDVIIK